MLRMFFTLITDIQSIRTIERSLFVRINHDTAFETHLPTVCPTVSTHPFPSTLWTLVFSKTSFLSLIWSQSCQRFVNCKYYSLNVTKEHYLLLMSSLKQKIWCLEAKSPDNNIMDSSQERSSVLTVKEDSVDRTEDWSFHRNRLPDNSYVFSNQQEEVSVVGRNCREDHRVSVAS